MNLRTYNVRPETSPVFELARTGDVKGILSLIERKDASVYDIDEDGEGVLHVCILLAPCVLPNETVILVLLYRAKHLLSVFKANVDELVEIILQHNK